MQFHSVVPKICLMLLATAIGMANTPLSAQTNRGDKSIKPLKASKLIGMKVENRDGVEFGKLRDLALDPRTGRIRYAIISSGGFLGVRQKLHAVPPNLLSAATAKRDTLALQLAIDDWKRAPTFRLSELPALTRPERR